MFRWRRFASDEGGQTVVIVALMFTVLLGFSALAIDLGRYYAERRFLQDGVDAAALACARAYATAGTSTAAYTAGADILTNYNLKGNPLGITVDVPAEGVYTYYDALTVPVNLKTGIRPQTTPVSGCRVALYIDVPVPFIRTANPGLATLALGVRAYAIAKGGLVPIVVPKYSNGPGPGTVDGANFIHHTSKSGSDYECSVSSDSLPGPCLPATAADPGREFVLFGSGQNASNDPSFSGYIALDIRDFTTADPPNSSNLVHEAYNGVAPDASVNTLKDFYATWIREGYPGPDICTVVSTSFQKCAQIAVINGVSAGIFVPEVEDRYRIGDVMLAQLYDGTVKTIPNFTISYPTLLIGNSTETVADQSVAFTFSPQYAASAAQVDTTFVTDDGTITGGTGDATNPWRTGVGFCACATAGTFSEDPTPPRAGSTSYSQTWSGITTTSAPQGIYVVFLKGQSGEPYPTASQLQIVTVNIAEQKKQFFIDTSDTYVNTASANITPRTATYTVRVTSGTGQSVWNGGANSITLQIDSCPKSGATTLTCYFGTPDTLSVTTSAGTTHTLTVEVPAGTSDGTTFSGWIRAYGSDGEPTPRKVTRVLEVRTAVNVTPGGTSKYVDVVGYAVFRVTAIEVNKVKGVAISGTALDPNDPALAIAKKYGLVPWETP